VLDLAKFNNATFSRGVSRWKESLWWLARGALFAPWIPLPSRLKVMNTNIERRTSNFEHTEQSLGWNTFS